LVLNNGGEKLDPKDILLVAIGGAIGAILRYLIASWVPDEVFPWGTLSVNLVGSFLLGCLACAVTIQGVISNDMMLLLGVGILGSFTTLSTYSVDTINMFESKMWGQLFAYIFSTAIIGPILAYGGWKITHVIL
jgi:CrcB protein